MILAALGYQITEAADLLRNPEQWESRFREAVKRDPEMRRFKLLWVFSSLYEHIKLRGRSPRPLAVLIDEISALTQKIMSGDNPLAAELDEFINQYMRGHNVWLTCIHQELHQLDEHMRNTLLSLGTYIIGGTSSMDSARHLADALFLRDPSRVKHWRKVWMSGGSINGRPQ